MDLFWNCYGQVAFITFLQRGIKLPLEFWMSMAVMSLGRAPHADISQGIVMRKLGLVPANRDIMNGYTM